MTSMSSYVAQRCKGSLTGEFMRAKPSISRNQVTLTCELGAVLVICNWKEPNAEGIGEGEGA